MPISRLPRAGKAYSPTAPIRYARDEGQWFEMRRLSAYRAIARAHLDEKASVLRFLHARLRRRIAEARLRAHASRKRPRRR